MTSPERERATRELIELFIGAKITDVGVDVVSPQMVVRLLRVEKDGKQFIFNFNNAPEIREVG